MSTTTNAALQVGHRLVELCRDGRFEEAVRELYADDAVSVEAMDGPHGRSIEGKPAILEMGEAWEKMHDVHSVAVEGPFPNGDGTAFICFMSIDVTAKEGPMAGQRMQMEEACRYDLNREGKIAHCEFYYPPTC